MLSKLKLPKVNPDKYGIIFMTLCVMALIGYTQPAVNVHLSFLDMTYSSSFGMATVFGESENPLDMLGMDESDLSEILAEVDMMEHFDYVRGRVVFAAISYVLVLLLLPVILGFTLWGKFKMAKLAMLTISIVLYVTVGTLILTVPEIVLDILTGAVEDILGSFAALVDVSGLIDAEPAAGYWITMLALAGMLLMEIAIFFKGKLAGGGQK